MNKSNVKIEVLKKTLARLIKAAPAKKPDLRDPVGQLVRAFLEYDCDEARAEVAEKKILAAMVDFNELRVTPAIELSALLGVRYPFAESRCSSLHRTMQSIFDREHQMRLERLKEVKKNEVRPYLQSLAGITPYVEAVLAVISFGVAAAPVDTKLLLWLISKDALPEGTDVRTAQQLIEKNLKVTECEDFYYGSRKELESWSPKSWPQVPKPGSPVLPANFNADLAAATKTAAAAVAAAATAAKPPVVEPKKVEVVKKEAVKEDPKAAAPKKK